MYLTGWRKSLGARDPAGQVDVCVGAVDTAMLAKDYDLSRAYQRTAFDGNVVCQFETQEALLDYAFERLSISGAHVQPLERHRQREKRGWVKPG